MDALLERLAAVYYGLAGLVVLLPSRRPRTLGGIGLALIGLAAAADATADNVAPDGFATINESLALIGVALVIAALLLALTRRSKGGLAIWSAADQALPRSPVDPLLLAGLLLAAFAPWILVLVLGTALALGFATRATLRGKRPAAFLLLLPSAASLGVGFVLLLTILGSEGSKVATLGDGPFSLAAERLLTLLIGGGALAVAGLPPFHRVPWGRALAPLCAILLLRLILPGFPAGLLTWQAAALSLLAVSLLWSAVARRWAQAAIAGGLMAMWSGAPGALAGSVLVGWGCLGEMGAALASSRGVRLSERWCALAALPAALAALPALRAGLSAQVVLSVAAAAACVAGLLLQLKRAAPAAQAPLY